MMRRGGVAAIAGTLACAGVAGAQETSSCTLLDNPTRTVNISNRGTQFETWFITEAVFECEGGRRIVADNATYAAGVGQITLNGAVRVDDEDRTLTSDFAQYFTETEQLHARGRVVLSERARGSRITSELLDIYQETPTREGLVIATGGRPRAVVFQREGETQDSTILDALEIRIEGEQSFRGTGNAVLVRDSLTARGRAIQFADATRRLDVMGEAIVQLPRQELRGDTIFATVNEQDEVEEVLAFHAASLDAEELDVKAPAIRLLFADGGVERLVAMMWQPAPGRASAERPHVESEDFVLDADSIDVLAPGQQVTAAVAIGDARGERILPDSVRALLPEADPAVLSLLSGDWIRGDTVRARFAPNPRAETDSTAAATVMEQLSANGQQAQSMYSVRDEQDPAARLSFNYLLSSYIEVNFSDGKVSDVVASGDARGVYLQPAEAARASRSSTISAADTRRRE